MACSQQLDGLVFFVNGRKVIERQSDPEELLLYYLRKKHMLLLNFEFCNPVNYCNWGFYLSGAKYGCGVGGCGACTVMISTYDPVAKQIQHCPANSCLLPICSLHGAAVTSGSIKTRIHSIQLRGTGQCCLDQEECVCSSPTGGQIHSGLCNPEEFPPVDPTQEFIFPPELMRVAQEQQRTTLVFHGKRTTWLSPTSLKELLELKAKHPKAPLVVGNTSVGMEGQKIFFQSPCQGLWLIPLTDLQSYYRTLPFRTQKNCHGVYHPIILHPVRIPEKHVVSSADDGLVIGAACCLAQLRDILMEAVAKLPEEEKKIYKALLQHLRTLAGEQIRSMVCSAEMFPSCSTLNYRLQFSPTDGKWQILLNDQFLAGGEHADIKPKEVIFSVLIPYSTKDDFISAFRQAESQKNALSIVNSGTRVLFSPGTDTTADLSILYGGTGSTTLSARKSCVKFIGRQWNDQMLNEACRLVLEEILLPPSALGGKVEYRRTLLVSFLFRFYLEELHGLHQMCPFRYAELSEGNGLGMLQSGVPQSVQIYQDVDPGQSPQDPVGCRIMYQSGIKHATGEAVSIDDIRPVDGELSLAVVTSIKAHAKIIPIDASEALQVPGVVDVVTARDVPGENGKDEQAYAEDKVIYVGQIICAVVAESLAQAKCGAEKVKIAYKDLEPVLTIEDVIEHNSNITEESKIEKGDLEKGFKSADDIIEGELHMGGQEHFYLETNSMLVIPRVEDFGNGYVCVSTQHATDVQELVASALNLQSNKIMCHVKPVGGAFSGKITKPSLFAVIAAVADNRTGCPVRFALDRNMGMLITGGHPFFGKYKTGALVHIYIDGSVLVTHGGIELGQGIHTKMLQVSDHELKIPLSHIHFCETSTTTVPNGKYTAGSVGMEINARAVQGTCQILWKHLDPIQRDNPNGKWEDWISEAHKQSISLSATGYFKGYVTNMNWDTQKGHEFPYFLFGAACSVVEIDHLTGAHKNIRTDIVMEACSSINPAIDIGQFEGAFIQGVGLYTLEEIYFSPEGEQLTLGPDTYKIPAICDIPEQFVYLLPNSHNSIAIYSSKGMGEAGFFLGSSVFFAIRDVVAAAQKERGLPLDFILKSPLTVEQIRMACDDVFTEVIPKDKPGTYKPWAVNID
ncbi:LOW QUALITY PROTEIN: aldehyde oxidase 2-like [Theristicus caerulescens]